MKPPLALKTGWTESPATTHQHSILDNLTTAEFAMALCQKQESLRSELCRTGSVKGVKPIKLTPNKGGRLLWPRRDVEALLLKLSNGPLPSPDKVEEVEDPSTTIFFQSDLKKIVTDQPSTSSTMECGSIDDGED